MCIYVYTQWIVPCLLTVMGFFSFFSHPKNQPTDRDPINQRPLIRTSDQRRSTTSFGNSSRWGAKWLDWLLRGLGYLGYVEVVTRVFSLLEVGYMSPNPRVINLPITSYIQYPEPLRTNSYWYENGGGQIPIRNPWNWQRIYTYINIDSLMP